MSAYDLCEEDWEQLAREAAYDLPTMVQLAPVSARQLQRLFARKFQRTPREWLLSLKLRRGKELIGLGYSTKAVVAQLSFSTPPYFCREFKKAFGSPPQCFAPFYVRKQAATQPRGLSSPASRLPMK